MIVVWLAHRKYITKSQFLVMVMAVVLGCVHLLVMRPEPAVFQRGKPGEEDSTETVYVKVDESRDDWKSYDISVPSVRYTRDELDMLYKQLLEELPKYFLGENVSVDQVSQDLELVDVVKGYPFDITWSISDMELISLSGEVQNQSLDMDTTCVVTAYLSCQEQVYSNDYVVTVTPPVVTHEERLQKEIADMLEGVISEQQGELSVTIPERMGGYWIYKTLPKENRSLIWPLFGGIWYLYEYAKRKEAIARQQKVRKKALLEAYPYFVNQMVLYLGAGMTIKGAMEGIWHSFKKTDKWCIRVLQMEMDSMFYEMESGVSEKQAYENFAKRLMDCGYGKIMSLMIQNLTLGSKGLLMRLEELEQEAFVKARELQRTKGEEISTKLLVPMILLLGVTMVLLVVPGFMGMS